jgi:hypothetical protein
MDRFAQARVDDWMSRFGPVRKTVEDDRYRVWLASEHPKLYANWSDAVSTVRFARDHAASLRDGLVRHVDIRVCGSVDIEIIGPYSDRAFRISLAGVTHIEFPRFGGLGAEVLCHYVLPLQGRASDEAESLDEETAYVVELRGERPLVIVFRQGAFSEIIFERELTREELLAGLLRPG